MAAPISRRQLLRGSAFAGMGAALTACGVSGSPSPSGSPPLSPSLSTPGSTPAEEPLLVPTGPLTFANRTALIDLSADRATSPTLEAFEEEYGIEVHYGNGETDDEVAFLASIRPQLERGVEPGWDLVVLSDWTAARMIASGWAERIDPANVPAARENLADELRGRPWDPTQEFHYPWISFATGIAWHRESTGRDLARIEDLFEPAFAGRVTLLREPRDTLAMVHLLLAARGVSSRQRADEMTRDDAVAAIDFLRPFVDGGHIRGFTDSGDVAALVDGTTVAAVASSRRLVSRVGEGVGFAYPTEGWLGSSHDLVVPRAAKHRFSAQLLIDWVYDPARAAPLTLAIQGISPVSGVADALARLDNPPDPEAPGYSLLFPPPGVRSRQHRHPNWDEATAAEIEDLFAELTGQ